MDGKARKPSSESRQKPQEAGQLHYSQGPTSGITGWDACAAGSGPWTKCWHEHHHSYWPLLLKGKEFQSAFLSFVLLVPVLPAMNIQLARPRSWACFPVDKENENLDFWTIQWEPMPSHPSMFLTGRFPWQSEGRSNDGQPKPQQRKCPS